MAPKEAGHVYLEILCDKWGRQSFYKTTAAAVTQLVYIFSSLSFLRAMCRQKRDYINKEQWRL